MMSLQEKAACGGAKAGGRHSGGLWDGCVHTAIFKMDHQQGPPIQHTGLWSVLRGSPEGGEFGGEWVRVCTAESLHCPPETITTLLIGCTPKQNKILKKERERKRGQSGLV